MANILLNNNLITVHNGGMLSAVGEAMSVLSTNLSSNLSARDVVVFTVDDISSWKIDDNIVFTPCSLHTRDVQQRKIVAIIDTNIFQIDIPLATDFVIEETSPSISHIYNLTRKTNIRGSSTFSRGGIRAVDDAKMVLKNIEFSNFGLLGVILADSVCLVNNKTHPPVIESCSYNGDSFVGSSFVRIAKEASRSNVSDAIIKDNIVAFAGDLSVDINILSPTSLSADIILDNNIFIKEGVWVTSISADEFIGTNNKFIDCTNSRAFFIKALDITVPQVSGNTFDFNKNAGLVVEDTKNTIFEHITGHFNLGDLVTLNRNSDITAQDIIGIQNSAALTILNIKDKCTVRTITGIGNNDGIFLHTAPRTSNFSVDVSSCMLKENIANGLSYTGQLPLVVRAVSAYDNNTGMLIHYDAAPPTFVNNMLISSNTLTGNFIGINSSFDDTGFLVPKNHINISLNTFFKGTTDIKSNSIVGSISQNYFDSTVLKSIDTSISNDSTYINQNTAVIDLVNSSYTFLNITGGLNYKDIQVNDNTLSARKVDINQGKIGIYTHEGANLSPEWPSAGVTLSAALSADRESIVVYLNDTNIRHIKFEYSGIPFDANVSLVASINDSITTTLTKANTQTIDLPPRTDIGRKFTKIILKFNNKSNIPKSIVISDIKVSYNGESFSSIDSNTFYYNKDISYTAGTNLATVLSAAAYNTSSIVHTSLGNTNFKQFKLYNNHNLSYLDLQFKLTSGLVVGSYLLEGSYMSVNTDSVFKFYQPNVIKTVGISNIVYPNASTHYKHGYILSDTSISRTNEQNNALSECMYPNTTNTAKLKSGKKYVIATAGSQVAVYVYVKVSEKYNGLPPVLKVSSNPALGIIGDRELDDIPLFPNGDKLDMKREGWYLLKGVTPAITRDGVLEFYVECTGTTGFVALDDWGAPFRNIFKASTITKHTVTSA